MPLLLYYTRERKKKQRGIWRTKRRKRKVRTVSARKILEIEKKLRTNFFHQSRYSETAHTGRALKKFTPEVRAHFSRRLVA